MTPAEVAELWQSEDLIEIGMRADGVRAQLDPFGVVTYCLSSEDLCYPLVVAPGDSIDVLLNQARESGMPAVQPVFDSNATGTEYLKLVALCRLYLTGTVLIQAAPALVGFKVAQLALRFGANDLGKANGDGTEERFRRLIRDAGFTPKQRDSEYKTLFVG